MAVNIIAKSHAFNVCIAVHDGTRCGIMRAVEVRITAQRVESLLNKTVDILIHEDGDPNLPCCSVVLQDRGQTSGNALMSSLEWQVMN